MKTSKQADPEKRNEAGQELTDDTLRDVAGGMRRRDGGGDKCWYCGGPSNCDCAPEIER